MIKRWAQNKVLKWMRYSKLQNSLKLLEFLYPHIQKWLSIAIQVSEIRIAQYFRIDMGIELALIGCIALRYWINDILAYCQYKNIGHNFSLKALNNYNSLQPISCEICKSRKILRVCFFQTQSLLILFTEKFICDVNESKIVP